MKWLLNALVIASTAGLAAWSGVAGAANRFAVANGAWNTTATWSAASGGAAGASIPVNGDDVFIGETNTARAVTIPAGYAAAATSVTIGTTAGVQNAKSLTLSAATASLSVSGDLTINKPSNNNNSDALNVNAGTVTVQGDLTLGGTTGTGSRDATILLTTGTLNIGGDLILVAGAAGNNVIDYSNGSGTINLRGAFTATVGTIQNQGNGVFNYSGTVAQTVLVNVSNLDYPNLYLNNTSAGGATLSAAIPNNNVVGDLQVQSGILNNGGFAIAGGAGEDFGVANGARFNLTGTSVMPTGFTTTTLGAASTVSFQGTAQTVAALSYGHLIFAGSGAKTAAGGITVRGNFTLAGTATFNGGTSRTHTFEGNWTVDTTAATPFTFTTGSILNFNTPAVAAQTTIDGTSAATLAFSDVNINNTSGVALNLNASFNTGATPTLTVTSTLTPDPAVILSGAGGTLTGTGTVQVTRTAATASFNAQYTIGTKTLTNLTVEYAGAAAQVVTNAQAYPRLEINNANGVTLSGGNVTVSTLLTLTDGNITTGGLTLITSATCATSVARTSGHVIGNLQKAIPAGASTCTFEVGSGNDYAPVVLVFAAGTGAGNIVASTTGTEHPQIAASQIDPANDVNRYWTLTNGGVTLPAAGYTARFNFINGSPVDFDAGATPASFFVERWSGTLWFPTTPNAACAPVSGAHLCEQINTSTTFGDFAIGEGFSGFNPNPGGFNVFETTTPAGSVIGRIFTKLAGTNFTLRIQAVANNVVNAAPSTNTLTIAILNSAGTPGAFNAATNCWSGWPTVGAATTVTTPVAWVAGQGRVDVLITSPAPAVRDARIRVTQTGTGVIGCSTDRFSIRPATLAVTSTNATNTTTAGAPVIKTGANFNLTATAVAGYDGTPLVDNTKVVVPATFTAGTLGGAFGAAPVGTGIATGGAFFYDEVGNFGLNAAAVYDTGFTSVDQPNDCTADFSNALVGGKYGCSLGSAAVASGTGLGFGRFIPDNFDVTANNPEFATGCGTFTYMGQPFSYTATKQPVMTVTARTGTANGLTNAATKNYHDAYMKLANTALSLAKPANNTETQAKRYVIFDALGGGNTPALNVSGLPPVALDPVISAFAAGAGTLTFSPGTGLSITRSTSSPTALFNADIGIQLAVIDEDGVTYGPSLPVPIAPALIRSATLNGGIDFSSGKGQRYGIMKLGNAVGSEKLSLTLPLEVQYWTGTGFALNTADNCTALTTGAPPPNIALGNYQGGLTAGNMGTSHISLPLGTFSSGALGLALTAPSSAATGSVDVTINLAAEAKTYLQPKQGSATYTDNPAGRAAFGVFGAQPKNFIYFREMY